MASSDLTMRLVGVDNASGAFNKVAASSKSLDTNTRSLTQSQGKAQSAFAATRRILTGLATSYAAIKVAQFGKDSVMAASDLHEAMSATNVTFKKNAAEMKSWASGAAAAFGQSQTQALSTARQFGVLMKSAGASQNKMRDYSQTLTQLASDLASFNNVSVDQAIQDLSSGLVGETEPLRKYGIFLNDAALKAEALKQGTYEGTGVLAQQAKVMAAYGLILKQTGTTSNKFVQQWGDFGRTSGGLANQLRTLSANWENFKAATGKSLKPLVNDVVHGLNEFLPKLEGLVKSGGFKEFMRSVGPKLRELFTGMGDELPSIKNLFGDLVDAAGMAGKAISSLWDAFNNMPDGVRQAIVTVGVAAVGMRALRGGGGVLGGGGHPVLGALASGAAQGGAEAVMRSLVGMKVGTMAVSAGVVNVSGKSVTGGGVPGAVKGGGASTASKVGAVSWLAGGASTVAGLLTSAAVVSAITVAAGAAYYKVVSPEPKRREQGGNPSIYAGSYGSSRSINPSGVQYTKLGLQNIARDAQAAAAAAGTLATKFQLMPGPARRAAAEANEMARAAEKAAVGRVVRLTVKGAKEAAADAENLANKIKRIQNKEARVAARGAREAARDAVDLANKVRAIPPSARVNITTNAEQARASIQSVVSAVMAADGKTAHTYTYHHAVHDGVGGGVTKNAARGGYISGPGTSTSDSIPARLSNGEYVVRAAAVAKYGRSFLDAVNSGSLAAFKKGGAADGKKLTDKQRQELADLRYARQGLRVSRRERRFEALGPWAAESKAQEWLNEAQAEKRRAKSTKDRTKALEALREAEERFSRSSAARKAAEDQRQAERDAAVAAAQDRALERVNAVREAVEASAGSYRSFASVAQVAAGDVAAADQQVKDAQDALTEARRKFDLAGSDRERAEAARELAKAQAGVAEAQRKRAETTEKVSAGSIRSTMSGKLARIREFAGAVRQLRANGLNSVTLADILAMGPEQGYEYAKALLDGGIGDLNSIQEQITAESASLGLFSAGVGGEAQRTIGAANLGVAGIDVNLVPAPVTLQLDGQTIASALLAYERQKG